MLPASTDPTSTLPIPPPAMLMDDQQLREWLAALRNSDVLPCRQTIREYRGEGMPAGKVRGLWMYNPYKVWDWFQDQIVPRDIRQLATDAACRRPRRTSQVS